MNKVFLLICLIGLMLSCKKETLETVPDNKAPNDQTVELTTIERYITRTYIRTLGREPDSIEALTAKTELINSNLDSTSRANFVNTIFSDPAYLPNLYDQNKINMLNNVDTSEFTFWIAIFNNILQDTSAMFQWPYIQIEFDRMNDMKNAYPEFVSGAIDIRELHRRMANNYLYDQINMGSDNFVISTFNHFVNRNPTSAEQVAGVTMLAGNNSNIFLETGESKTDYLNIITNTSNYDEAQVVLLYLKYLDRIPTSYEMATGTQLYSTTNDYTAVQKVILSSNEFIGIQ